MESVFHKLTNIEAKEEMLLLLPALIAPNYVGGDSSPIMTWHGGLCSKVMSKVLAVRKFATQGRQTNPPRRHSRLTYCHYLCILVANTILFD